MGRDTGKSLAKIGLLINFDRNKAVDRFNAFLFKQGPASKRPCQEGKT